MNEKLEVGQVLALVMMFNRSGEIAKTKHPYLIVDINNDIVEIAQLDKVKGKAWKLAFESNVLVSPVNPNETVIDEESFMQCDNKFVIENYPELIKYRRQGDKLSKGKLENIINYYKDYHKNHIISDEKSIYLTKTELEEINNAK